MILWSHFLRVNHELLGQLSKREEAWTPLRIPAGLMSDLIQAVTTGEITGTQNALKLTMLR